MSKDSLKSEGYGMYRTWREPFICIILAFVLSTPALRSAVGEPSIDYPLPGGHGYLLKSGSDNYTLRLGMFTQLQMFVSDMHDDSTNVDQPTDTSMYVRRLFLEASGAFWDKRLTFFIQPGFFSDDNTGGSITVFDLWGNMSLKKGSAQFKAGQFKVPFLREANVPENELFFIDYSLLYQETFSLRGRDDGVMLHGYLELGSRLESFGYAFGFFDGRGANRSMALEKGTFATGSPFSGQNITEGDLMVSGRIFFFLGRDIRFRPLGEGYRAVSPIKGTTGIETEFGLSYSLVNGTEGDTTNLRAPDLYPSTTAPHDPSDQGYAIDVTVRGFNGFEGAVEFLFKGHKDTGNAAMPVVDYSGVKAQLTYAINQTIGAFGFCYSQFDPDNNIDNNESNEYRIGWNKYIGGLGHANKISINLTETRTWLNASQLQTKRGAKFQWQITL